MGLLRAGIGALTGALSDSWRDYLYCEALPADVLAAKGKKRAGKRSSNRRGDENVISNGSIVVVNEGQCMMIVDQGKVAEFCAEPGEFVYDTSTEPSLFYGDFGQNLLASFESVGRRFGFGGEAGKDQRVYFFNTKEIMGNKYGTPSPIPFRVIDRNIDLDIDISIRCHGEYSFKIVDPMMFYTNVCGNVEDEFTREEIESQLRTELMTAMQPAFARISEMGIRYSALPGHTMELADALNEVLSQKWRAIRGIAIVSFGVSAVKASEEDEQMIKTLQKNAALRNPNMAAATLVGAQADAMVNASKNQGQGPVMAFAGMNMAQQAGGMNAQSLFQMGAQAQPQQPAQPQLEAGLWTCKCGAKNKGKFCAECGNPKPEDGFWTCACGAKNKGKFCSECGKAKPVGARVYKCDKCGYEPDPAQPLPRFCPECGDPFDENDAK